MPYSEDVVDAGGALRGLVRAQGGCLEAVKAVHQEAKLGMLCCIASKLCSA
jgi:hypothetical protein